MDDIHRQLDAMAALLVQIQAGIQSSATRRELDQFDVQLRELRTSLGDFGRLPIDVARLQERQRQLEESLSTLRALKGMHATSVWAFWAAIGTALIGGLVSIGRELWIALSGSHH